MSEEQLRGQLYGSFRHRARLYYLIFDELRRTLDEPRAIELLQRAIRRRGEEIGQRFAQFAPDDLAGLRDAFLSTVPDEGRMFAPTVDHCDDQRLDITLHSCPLRDAWLDDGLDPEEAATMCRIAAIVDEGTFVGAGFEFSADTWAEHREACCRLHIKPGSETHT
ncbi:MAG: L-2-amino-thiazoline-4-carboxylic acid hydrolase [Planctomycetota bacterium]